MEHNAQDTGTPETATPRVTDPTPEVSVATRDASIEGTLATLPVDLQRKTQAYALFLSTNQSPEEIALSVSLPGFLIRHWIATEKWSDLKARVQLQAFKRSELEYQELIQVHRITTARRHLETSKRLEDEILYVLKDMEQARAEREEGERMPRNHDMTLVRLSQALKNATDVSARVVGITDKAPLSEGDVAKAILLIGGRPAQSARFSESPKEKSIEAESIERKPEEEKA